MRELERFRVFPLENGAELDLPDRRGQTFRRIQFVKLGELEAEPELRVAAVEGSNFPVLSEPTLAELGELAVVSFRSGSRLGIEAGEYILDHIRSYVARIEAAKTHMLPVPKDLAEIELD